MRVHIAWFVATILVACATGYVTYSFTREAIFAAQLSLSVSEAKMYERLLASLDKGDVDLARVGVRDLKDASVSMIKSLMPILEEGHFQVVTQSDINSGKKYLNSPNKPLEPTR